MLDSALLSRRQGNISWHGVLLTMSVWAGLLAGCASYLPGRQVYWDNQVRELCAKDGGFTVYERIELTREEYERLGGLNQGLPIPDEGIAKPGFPYVREEVRTTLREANPRVMRGETLIKRRSDNKVLARSVRYWRTGGDLPTGLAEESNFICPEQIDLSGTVFTVKSTVK
jgi:hypothetical protein